MSVYLHTTLETRPDKFQKFCETMQEIVSIVEQEGWKLAGAFMQRTGRLHNVIDLWELEDYNHFDRGLQALGRHPRFPHISAALAECVISETIVFADRAPYMH